MTDEISGVDDSDEAKNLILSRMETQYYESLFIMNQITEEINVSRMQKFKKSQMLLKKIPHTSVWMLLRSTGERNHIFYTIFWRKSDMEVLDFGNLTPEIVEEDDCQMIDIRSTDHEKLSHLLNCHMKWIALEMMLQQTFECPVGVSNESILSHVNLLMMTYLEDKEVTSRNFQNIRFINKYTKEKRDRGQCIIQCTSFRNSTSFIKCAK